MGATIHGQLSSNSGSTSSGFIRLKALPPLRCVIAVSTFSPRPSPMPKTVRPMPPSPAVLAIPSKVVGSEPPVFGCSSVKSRMRTCCVFASATACCASATASRIPATRLVEPSPPTWLRPASTCGRSPASVQSRTFCASSANLTMATRSPAPSLSATARTALFAVSDGVP